MPLDSAIGPAILGLYGFSHPNVNAWLLGCKTVLDGIKLLQARFCGLQDLPAAEWTLKTPADPDLTLHLERRNWARLPHFKTMVCSFHTILPVF